MMTLCKKYWIIGILIAIVLVVFLLLRERGNSGMSSKPIHQPKPIQAKSGRLSGSHTDTKNPSKMAIYSDEKGGQIPDNGYRRSETEKNQDDAKKDLSKEEIAKLLDEYLSQYEGNEDVPSPEESKKSKNQDEELSWFMGPDGVRHYMRPGDVLVFERWTGTQNPRPRTEEEKRKAVEISQEMNDLRKQLTQENPPGLEQVTKIFARIAELQAELDKIDAETSLPGYHKSEVRLHRIDPETGEVIK